MSTTVSVAGSSYSVPAEGDSNWANDVSNLLIQLSTSSKVLQVSSSSFPLTQELSFGTNFGLKVQYLKSQASNPAGTGTVRLGNSESLKWRNQANNGDLDLTVTSSDQLQFNGNTVLDAGGSGLSGLITNAMVSPSAAIAYSKLNLSSEIVDSDISNSAAIAYVKLNLASSIVNTDIDAAAGISYSKLALSNSIVNADINSSASIAYSKLNLSSSIVNGDISPSASIAYSKLNLASSIVNADIHPSASIGLTKLAALTASRAVVTDVSGVLSSSTVSSTELGYLSGVTSGIQTQITAKTDKATLTTTGDMYYASSASTPARLAVGSSGQVLKSVGGIPTWATFSGGINYLSSNPDAEADTSGWSTYADAAGTSPVDGTGGSPNSTWTRSTSSPLRGSGSFLWTKSANNRQGEGVSYAFTIDSSDKAKPLQVSFDYIVDSGTFVAGSSSSDSDMTVWIYDVTNSILIQPSNYKLFSNSSGIADKFTGTFQTLSNSTSYRLIIHTGSTSASAYTLKFDNFNVGPQVLSSGTPISDWQSFTPLSSWVSNVSHSAWYARHGDSIKVRGRITTSGAPTSATLTISLPPGLSFDTTKMPTTSQDTLMGTSIVRDSAAGTYTSHNVYFGSSSTVYFAAGGLNTFSGSQYIKDLSVINATTPITFGASDYVDYEFQAPISGWSSSVRLSSENDTREVAFHINQGLLTAFNTTAIKVPFSVQPGVDTHGAWNSSNQTYTIPVSGTYIVSTGFSGIPGTNPMIISFQVWKNGSLFDASAYTATIASGNTVYANSGAKQFKFVAGDVLSYHMATAGGNATLANDIYQNYFSIRKESGSSTISATETVAASYKTTSGQPVATAGTTVVWNTKDFDTHSGMNTSTGVYIAPVSGLYQVSASIAATTPSIDINIYFNGIHKSSGRGYASSEAVAKSIYIGRLVAGQGISIVSNSYTGNLNSDGAQNTISILRVGN